MEKLKLFERRAEKFLRIAEELKKRSTTISILRVLLFLIAIILIVFFANARNLPALITTTLIFTFVFSALINHHNRINQQQELARNKSKVNKDEILRLNNELYSFDEGKTFINHHHTYSSDLDIFGRNSIFQLINRTSTSGGKETLAKWLTNKALKEEIIYRQEAIKELSTAIDWRQEFQVKGQHPAGEDNQVKTLLLWMDSPPQLNKKLFYQIGRIVFPILFLISFILFITFVISYYWVISTLIINGFILKSISKYAGETTENTDQSIHALKAYSTLIQMVEKEHFNSELLMRLRHDFQHDRFTASRQIKKLQFILDNLQSRKNLIYAIFNIIFLFDLHWLIAGENWKVAAKDQVTTWFDAINEFEVLNSLAGFYFANPQYKFPSIQDTFRFEAKNLGHPLINAKKRVCNDFKIQGKGEIAIITGSNMSGKSTFLRTVGVNTILALMGAPVCADEMKVSDLQLFTSMRTQDNLEESISSFYAELKRVKELLDTLAKDNQQLLFLLDEILKGTNSKDRNLGATSLIIQLNKKNTFGLVSTHDLQLGKMESELNGIKNFSFNSQIQNHKILFDYKLKEGICHSFNASELMKKMGIEIKD